MTQVEALSTIIADLLEEKSEKEAYIVELKEQLDVQSAQMESLSAYAEQLKIKLMQYENSKK